MQARSIPTSNIDGVTGGVHLPLDGQCDPANIAMALARGARQRGARIVENVKVTAVTTARTAASPASPGTTATARAAIAADIVVNCAGMWGRDLAAAAGVTLPLHACEHFYIVTEPIPGLGQLPVLRVPDECAYYKEDAGKILLGAFEPVAKPWGMDGIREDFAFDQLPEDFDHFEPILEKAVRPHADPRDRRHPHLLQRPRELHPRRPLLSRRGAGAPRLLGGRRLQLGRHRLAPAAPASRWRSGSRTASRPSTSGTSTSAGRNRSSATAATCASG